MRFLAALSSGAAARSVLRSAVRTNPLAPAAGVGGAGGAGLPPAVPPAGGAPPGQPPAGFYRVDTSMPPMRKLPTGLTTSTPPPGGVPWQPSPAEAMPNPLWHDTCLQQAMEGFFLTMANSERAWSDRPDAAFSDDHVRAPPPPSPCAAHGAKLAEDLRELLDSEDFLEAVKQVRKMGKTSMELRQLVLDLDADRKTRLQANVPRARRADE